MQNKFWLYVAGFCLLAGSSHASSGLKVESFTLNNGLEVIVIPNHRVPAVNHTIWYKIGAADDPSGKSGLAHYHEHAMFLGTKKYKSGEFSNIIARNGGEQNAFTGHDATGYFINISKENLPLAMEMEADRMGEMAASDADMEKEKQVIIEERRMRVDNNPGALLSEQVAAALFRNHPYHFPIIGWQHEMYGLTKKDVIDFHKKWYHPNNAILIVSGDVTTEEVKKLAEKYYGGLKNVPVPERKWKDEPPQIAERRVTLHHDQVTEPEFSIVYATSSLGYNKKEETLPLFVLAQILGGGKASRLYISLVTEQKLAASVDVGYSGFARGPGEFSIDAVPQKGIATEQLEKAINKELEKFLSGSVNEEELKRAKILLKAESIFARDGLSGIANIMGWVRMCGLPADYFTRWPELVEKITAAEVMNAAKNTIKKEQSVVALLLPQEKKPENKEGEGK